MKLLHYSESVGKGAARFVHHKAKNLVNATLPNNSLLEVWLNPVSNTKTLVENAFGFRKTP